MVGVHIFVFLSLRFRKQRDSVIIMLHRFATPKNYSIGLYSYKDILVLGE